MDLKDFVAKVLVDLDSAVEEARKGTNRDIYFATSKDSQNNVEFDIAVSSESSDGKSGKAGVKVLGFVEGGAQIENIEKNSTISRVKFGVNIKASTKSEEETTRREIEAHNSRSARNFY